jgi:uncharacterized phiE125 gp8 family phage protein
MSTIKITEPGEEPVCLDEARLHLRVDPGDEDPLISSLITAARQMCEGELGRTLITTTWEMATDQFDPALRLDWPRVIDVESLTYVDDTGVVRTLDPQDYRLDAANDAAAAWLVPARGKSWPMVCPDVNAVRVRYRAGYGDTADTVPKAIRQWILLHVAAMYEQREAVAAKDMKAVSFLAGLIEQYRVW